METRGKAGQKHTLGQETGVRNGVGEHETGGEETQLKQILPGDVIIIPNSLYSN